MIVAAYQSSLAASYTSHVVPTLREQVRECERFGVEVLCCAEGVLGGLADYVNAKQRLVFDTQSSSFADVVAALASDTVTTIVGFTERGSEGALYNAAAVLYRGALVGVYRKRHVAINRSVYSAGLDTPVFTVGTFTFGILICRDAVFAEGAQALSAKGATALFIPANNGMPPSRGGATLIAATQAIDVATATLHDTAVIRADVAGATATLTSFGCSAIVNRSGMIVTTARPNESELIVADIDVAARKRSG